MTTYEQSEENVKALIITMYCGKQVSKKYRDDLLARDLICSEFGGAYGRAGWVFCLEGSPPRGTIVCMETEAYTYMPPAIFFLEQDRSRRVGEAQAEIVRDWVRHISTPRFGVKEGDKIGGDLFVGLNSAREVVIDLGGDKTGHINFSPHQARSLAQLLLIKADDADGCITENSPPRQTSDGQPGPRAGTPV